MISLALDPLLLTVDEVPCDNIAWVTVGVVPLLEVREFLRLNKEDLISLGEDGRDRDLEEKLLNG